MPGEPPDVLLEFAINLFRQGHSADEITTRLRNKGAEDNLLQQALAEIKRLRITRQRNNGFIWCSIGTVLLVTGCLLTIMLHINGQNIRLVMYSLTSIGIIIIMKGLKDVFGW